jgi:HPt (histidine-containing phosphotransfer) domain-containing protein
MLNHFTLTCIRLILILHNSSHITFVVFLIFILSTVCSLFVISLRLPSREEKELEKFSKSAHFLKGSSAQLGITSLPHTCTTLQHYGELWDDKKDSDRTKNMSEDESLKLIPPILNKAKQEYKAARRWMELYLANDPKEKLELPEVKETPGAEEKTTPPGKKPVDSPNGVRRSSIPVKP